MIEILRWLGILLRAAVRERRDWALENLALRQQRAVLKRKGVPRLRWKDRWFWVVFSRLWLLGDGPCTWLMRTRSWVGNGRASEPIGPRFRRARVGEGRPRVPRLEA